MSTDVFQQRKDYSKQRLADLQLRVAAIPELNECRGLSIYVTGSYGRCEASARSDLDLFLISNAQEPLNRIAKTLIDAQLIKIAQELRFPPFSNTSAKLMTLPNTKL